MPNRKTNSAVPYTELQVTHWLSCLARGMQQHAKTMFLIEQLQPEWLASSRQRIGNQFCFSLVLGIMIGWIAFKSSQTSQLLISSQNPPMSLALWCISTIIWMLIVGGLESWKPLRWTHGSKKRKPQAFRSTAVKTILYWLVWLPVWLSLLFIRGELKRELYLFGGRNLADPLLIGGIVAIIYVARVSQESGAETVEALGWSWQAAWKGLIGGGVAGIGIWIVYLILAWFEGDLGKLWMNLMIYLPIGGIGGFLFMGLSISYIQTKTVPNQGIKLSLINALTGALIGPIMALVCGLAFTIALKVLIRVAIEGAFWFGLIISLIAFIWFGGLNVIRHYVLRFILYLGNQAPLHYARFLDYAANELNFLQKVGGGYIFIHRYLLEHFAAMAEDKQPVKIQT